MPLVQLIVTMPSKGNKELLRKFYRIEDLGYHSIFSSFFADTLHGQLVDTVGALNKVKVTVRGSGESVEVYDISDNMGDYLSELDIKEIIFQVDQPRAATADPPTPLTAVLHRQSVLDQTAATCTYVPRLAN